MLAIHQASFPAGDDDLGHGTPYSGRGRAFVEHIARLGFTGLMLGPAGLTSRDNPSPYDGTALSRNPLHIAAGDLTRPEWGLLDPGAVAAATAAVARSDSGRVSYRAAWDAQRALLDQAAAAARARADLTARVAAFRAGAPWLAAEERYEAIAAAVGHDDWREWPPLDEAPRDDDAAARFALAQLIVHAQHDAFRRHTGGLGLALYADLPIGLGHRDRLLYRHLFLDGYAMGAPPSRTNPDGQPWGYPVLDPDGAAGGPVRDFIALRVDKLLTEHDGLRIDHPHGWVCPWVYRTDLADPLAAVQAGARLHESPDLADHPALAEHARVRPDQIDRARPRHADDWVRDLEPAQIDRYATVFDLVVDAGRAHGVDPGDLVAEVLSTCPRPLALVLARHHLGRFRVTQKARVDDPTDVYRGDRAAAEDWIMVGNHDTPPLRLVVERWHGTDEAARRAGYLAARLSPDDAERAALARRLEADPGAMASALVADLFVGPARNVQIFWVDLFGSRDVYNRPGVVAAENWCLRVPADFEAAYAAAVAAGDAPDLGDALARALHARGLDRDDEGRSLVAALTDGRPQP